MFPSKGKNPYLSMRGVDQEWMGFKGGTLATLAGPKPVKIEKTIRWHSLCYPIFWDFAKLYYKDGERCLRGEALDRLNDVAFAVWLADCGSYDGRCVTLNTHVWGEDGSKAVRRYFKQIGYKSQIVHVRGGRRVVLDEEASAGFLSLAVPHLPHRLVIRKFGSES